MALSRDDVLAGALRLLEEVGLDGLTMRRLAHSLDVQAGAIYWHFAGKQDLVDAMADEQLQGLLEPPVEGPWDRQLAELSRRLATALIRRRDGARLATSALMPGPNGLAVSESLLRVAREAGLPKKTRLWATAVLGYYVLGYVTDVQATAAARARGLTSALAALKKQLDPKQYPELAQVAEGDLARLITGRSFRARFEYGLEVILEGLAAERRRSRAKKKAR